MTSGLNCTDLPGDGDAPAPVLEGVCAEGRLDAVPVRAHAAPDLPQHERSGAEVIYTFPLPFQAVPLWLRIGAQR